MNKKIWMTAFVSKLADMMKNVDIRSYRMDIIFSDRGGVSDPRRA